MAKVYADLIRKGVKTIDDVPEQLRDEVQAILDSDTNAQVFGITFGTGKGGVYNGNSLCNSYH